MGNKYDISEVQVFVGDKEIDGFTEGEFLYAEPQLQLLCFACHQVWIVGYVSEPCANCGKRAGAINVKYIHNKIEFDE